MIDLFLYYNDAIMLYISSHKRNGPKHDAMASLHLSRQCIQLMICEKTHFFGSVINNKCDGRIMANICSNFLWTTHGVIFNIITPALCNQTVDNPLTHNISKKYENSGCEYTDDKNRLDEWSTSAWFENFYGSTFNTIMREKSMQYKFFYRTCYYFFELAHNEIFRFKQPVHIFVIALIITRI